MFSCQWIIVDPTAATGATGGSGSYCHLNHAPPVVDRRVRKRTRDKITARLQTLLRPPEDLEPWPLFLVFGWLVVVIIMINANKIIEYHNDNDHNSYDLYVDNDIMVYDIILYTYKYISKNVGKQSSE